MLVLLPEESALEMPWSLKLCGQMSCLQRLQQERSQLYSAYTYMVLKPFQRQRKTRITLVLVNTEGQQKLGLANADGITLDDVAKVDAMVNQDVPCQDHYNSAYLVQYTLLCLNVSALIHD